MGIVYFARAGQTGSIKIGFTDRDPSSRLVALQVGCPEKITIIGAVAGNRENERWAHQEFANLRGIGEWFEADDQLLRFIESTSELEFSWPDPIRSVTPPPAIRDFSSIDGIIRSCGGASMIAAHDGDLTCDAVYKWRSNGCPWWRWRSLMKLCGVTAAEIHAANNIVRSAKSGAAA